MMHYYSNDAKKLILSFLQRPIYAELRSLPRITRTLEGTPATRAANTTMPSAMSHRNGQLLLSSSLSHEVMIVEC
jgi:hypothetical protein